MTYIARHLPDLVASFVGLVLQIYICFWLLRRSAIRNHPTRRALVLALSLAGCMILGAAVVARPERIGIHLNVNFRDWLGAASLMLIFSLLISSLLIAVLRLIPRAKAGHSPARRGFLLAARGAVFTAPVVAAGYAVFIQRSNFTAREISLPIRGLAPELDGLKLVQLSDIHLSPFLSEREFARAVDMANEFRAHLGLITGDLITTHKDPLDQCIRQLKRLKTDAGSIGCMGNHEFYAGLEQDTERMAAAIGIDFLRSQSRIYKFRGKPINFAGVDYQPMKTPYLVGAEQMIQPGMPNILLSHNPDVFPQAEAKGYDGIVSGHTHGGQISVEILHKNLSMARFYTPYVYGLYQKGKSSIYVTRGIGTVGIPARLGAPPEIALIRLCAI